MLDTHVLGSVAQVREETQARLTRYNTERPCDSLVAVPPRTFLPRPHAPPESTSQLSAWLGSSPPNRRATCTPNGPDQLWVAALTYVRTGRRFAYVTILLATRSRRVVGYAIGPVLDAPLPLTAPEAEHKARQFPPGYSHHSTRGSQSASRLEGSMSLTGNPNDHAHAESFMKPLKHEEINGRGYQSMEQLMHQLPLYLERTYNTTRLHSALGYRTPKEYEAGRTAALARSLG